MMKYSRKMYFVGDKIVYVLLVHLAKIYVCLSLCARTSGHLRSGSLVEMCAFWFRYFSKYLTDLLWYSLKVIKRKRTFIHIHLKWLFSSWDKSKGKNLLRCTNFGPTYIHGYSLVLYTWSTFSDFFLHKFWTIRILTTF